MPIFFGRQVVLGYFLGLELQKLLMGYLSGTFINRSFCKCLRFSLCTTGKILLVREPIHIGPPDSFGGWAPFRVRSRAKLEVTYKLLRRGIDFKRRPEPV